MRQGGPVQARPLPLLMSERRTEAPHTFSFEFFPPKTPEGMAKLRAALAAAGAAQARFLLRHLRCGRLDARRHAATVLEIRGEGHDAAPHISCIGAHAREHSRGDRSSYKAQRHPPHRRAARRPALGRSATSASSATPPSWSTLIRERRATGSTSRSPPIPSTIRRRARPQARPGGVQRQGRGRRELRDHAVFLQRRRVLPLRRRGARAGHRHPDRAGHHADHQLLAAGALLRRLRRRDPALDAPEARRLRRRHRVDQGLRPRRGDAAVRTPARRRRAGPALLHHEPWRAPPRRSGSGWGCSGHGSTIAASRK